jgi:PRC-barrel domain
MLQSVNDLKGYGIIASDVEIGNIEECYFDDLSFVVRYIVANTGSWLTGKQKLISPFSVTHLDRQKHNVHINLTKEQVVNSPGIEKHQPFSRQIEKIISDYYGNRSTIESGVAAAPAPDVHLRSMHEIANYKIVAIDGVIGQLEDFFLETDDWSIRYIGVDTNDWLQGKHILISSMWLGQISWSERTVAINLTRNQIESSPDYDQVTEISREYETRLHKHYEG